MKLVELIKVSCLIYLSLVMTALLFAFASFEMPDFSKINNVIRISNNMTDSLSEYKELLDELPIKELLERCDNIDCVDRVLGRIMTYEPCRIGWDC